MFSPNQTGELIVGNAIATEPTVADFVDTATAGEIALYAKSGGLATDSKTPFYFLQKTAGDAAKNLNYEFSDVIDPRYVEKITVAEYAAETPKSVKIDGFTGTGVVAALRTYEIEIRVENQLSPENFEQIVGYYVTGEVLGSDNATTVRDGLIDSINKNLARRGNSEFTVVADGTGILVTEKLQDNTPGKDAGRKYTFSVTGKVFNNVANGYNTNLNLLTSTVVTPGSYGTGTGKWATNFEWFVKGYKYDDNRLMGYPADFWEKTPFYTSKTGEYDVIQIRYYAPRKETSVERQYKVLTIIVDTDGAVDDVLAALRLAVDPDLVPDDINPGGE